MNRFVRIAGTALVACAMSVAVSAAWAQPGKANGRGNRDADTRQSGSRQTDAERQRERGMSKEDREQLRRDIRDHGRDVYQDRDGGRDRDSRPRRDEHSRR